MADGDRKGDCDGKHDPQDYLIHYTKCLEFSDREEYFESNDDEIKGRIDSELRRIEFLRKTLESDEDDKLLVGNLRVSHEEWKKDDLFKSNIAAVQSWRDLRGRVNKIYEPRFFGDKHDLVPYDPEVDFNAYAISFDKSTPVEDFDDKHITGTFPNHKINMVDLLRFGDDNPLTVAGKRASGASDKVAHSGASASSEPAAKKGCSSDALTYFHLPANNMSWVEKAMSRYYGERDFDYDTIDREPSQDKRTRAYMLLRPQFWKGQEYGSRSTIVHARHMRPICEIISTNTTTIKLDSTPNNIVLFCPYLHWDTDRYRDRISQIIGKEAENERVKNETETNDELQARRKYRTGLRLPNGKLGTDLLTHWPTNQPKVDETSEFAKPAHTFTSILQPVLAPYPKLERHFRSKLFKRDHKTGRILAGHKLGQVLIDAARLYEAMSCFRDKSLLKRYLHHDPPLHPRRTLDQAYYCTLKSTKWRDRDQVVYRGTRANPCHLHSIDPKTRRWNCPGRQDIAESAATQHARHRERAMAEEDRVAAELAYKCPECTDHIRKVARLVMVDQLWMWILDEKTLVTCFPRRYGFNSKDPSGVHHLVRRHLKNIRQEHIRTVFDLALIVLIEVTNIFFDRAKTPDHQPQVIDIFADAIGEITNKQAVAFDHLWVWTSKIVTLTSPSPLSDITSFVFPLLNINPEGKLQREIKDIVDELDIMLLINRQQLEVIRKFVKHAEDILDPKGRWRDLKGSRFGSADSDGDDDDGGSPSSGCGKSAGGTKSAESAKAAKLAKKKKDYLWFKSQADAVLSNIETHIHELSSLRDSAKSTSSSLDNLLGLMQQQASALQAWQSARQAEETVKQGRAIMMFTTVTIIFLPLSFMTGIFGMNNTDFSTEADGNTMTLRQQLQFMLPISLSIILVALVLAYAARSKPIVAVFWQFLVSMVIIKLGFFNLWLTLTWKRDKLVRTTDRWIKDMKKGVLKRRQGRMEDHLKREQAKIDAKAKKNDSSGAGGTGTATGSLRRGSSIMMSRLTRGGSRSSAAAVLDTLNGGESGTPVRPKMSGANGAEPGSTTIPAMTTWTTGGGETTGSGVPTAGQSSLNEPRESTISGFTTLAPTSTTGRNPSGSSAPIIRGGGGERMRFLGGSPGDIV